MTNALQSPSLTYDEYLEHYGVKGMKWGVRKNRTGHVKAVVRRTPLRGSDESKKDPIVRSKLRLKLRAQVCSPFQILMVIPQSWLNKC